MEFDHHHPAFRLDGKVAAITGAGSGMGRAIAQTLAAAGAAVVVGDIDVATGCATRDDIRAEGGRAVFAPIDVFRRADLEAMMQTAVDEFGALHLVANLGGPPTPTMPLLDVIRRAVRSCDRRPRPQRAPWVSGRRPAPARQRGRRDREHGLDGCRHAGAGERALSPGQDRRCRDHAGDGRRARPDRDPRERARRRA